MTDREHSRLRIVLTLHGGILLLVGMLGGLGYGAVLVWGMDAEAIANWRIVHVQNLQNGMLLLLVAACAGFTALSSGAFRAITWILVVAAYCDGTAWFIRAATGHTGVMPGPPVANQIVFALFVITVAAAEAAVGLAILVSLNRDRTVLNVDEVNLLKW